MPPPKTPCSHQCLSSLAANPTQLYLRVAWLVTAWFPECSLGHFRNSSEGVKFRKVVVILTSLIFPSLSTPLLRHQNRLSAWLDLLR